MFRTLSLAAAVAVLAVPAMAQNAPSQVEAPIWAYKTSTNYCPAGLQPITLSGVICCGVPNQGQSYQSMYPQAKRTYSAPRKRAACPVGAKGCSTY